MEQTEACGESVLFEIEVCESWVLLFETRDCEGGILCGWRERL
jgi:hypothetical protein